MNMYRLTITLAAILAVTGGCATSPVVPEGVVVSATGPAHVLDDENRIGDRVVWGGRIVELENRAEHTELIVASYPLDRADRPRIDQEAGVRFVLLEEGFLEPVEYAPGRFVTVLGTVSGVAERRTGEFVHDHPVVEAERIHLWSRDPAQWQARTRFGIGIGVRL